MLKIRVAFTPLSAWYASPFEPALHHLSQLVFIYLLRLMGWLHPLGLALPASASFSGMYLLLVPTSFPLLQDVEIQQSGQFTTGHSVKGEVTTAESSHVSFCLPPFEFLKFCRYERNFFHCPRNSLFFTWKLKEAHSFTRLWDCSVPQ